MTKHKKQKERQKQKQKQSKPELTITKQEKQKIKQQARQLLLKGCYLMAARKYERLIDMGLKEFTPRQQSIIYLNTGICYQFLCENNQIDNNYAQALKNFRQAISRDSTYQKCYYRLLQILRDHGHYQTALKQVPNNIKNPQIKALADEIRILYLLEQDFQKVFDTFKNKKQVQPQHVKVVNNKLEQQISKFEKKNFDITKRIENQQFLKEVNKLSFLIGTYYYQIGTNHSRLGKDKQQKQNIKQSLAEFFYFVNNLFNSLENKKKSMILVQMLFEDMLCYYRSQLNKFLDMMPQYAAIQKHINQKTSAFLCKNQFTKLTKRTIFYPAQKGFMKHTRLIDILIPLFGKVFLYFSDQMYDQYKKVIRNQININNYQKLIPNSNMFEFRLVNKIDSQQVIRSHLNIKNPKISLKTINGGHPQYLYNNISQDELNFMKILLVQQCHKFASIYESSIIHPVWLDKLIQILDTINSIMKNLVAMIKIYSHRNQKLSPIINQITQISQLSHLIYIHHIEITKYEEKMKQIQLLNQAQRKQKSQPSKSKQKPNAQQQQEQLIKISIPSVKFQYNFQSLINYFQKTQQNFIGIYLIQKILQFMHKQLPSNRKQQIQQLQSRRSTFKARIIQICLKKLQYYKQKIVKVQKIKIASQGLYYVYKEMYLMVLCILMKFDIKKEVDVDQGVIFKEIYNDVFNQVALEAILLMMINKPSYIVYHLENISHLTAFFKHLMFKPQWDLVDSFKIIINIVYMLLCDFQQDQEQYFAKKLGVTKEEVHQVRKLQKENINQKEKEKLNKLRKNFKINLSKQWIDVLNQLCYTVRCKFNMESTLSVKVCKIITTVAQVNPSKLYSNQMIEFMLEARKIKETSSFQFNIQQVACKFFQHICKKCNPQVFEYKHVQSIVDSLLWLLNHCEHQLSYFQSLLGLVSLSTLRVRIPIQTIQKCLYEQNLYILHAGICTMNNILIYNQELQEDEGSYKKIIDRLSNLVYSYVQFYRDQIQYFQSELPQSDYSHPKKIYNSLISLATVLKLDKLQQLDSWQLAKKYVKIIANNSQGPQLLFKLVIYHSLENKLPTNWFQGFQAQLAILKSLQPQKYMKIAQFL